MSGYDTKILFSEQQIKLLRKIYPADEILQAVVGAFYQPGGGGAAEDGEGDGLA